MLPEESSLVARIVRHRIGIAWHASEQQAWQRYVYSAVELRDHRMRALGRLFPSRDGPENPQKSSFSRLDGLFQGWTPDVLKSLLGPAQEILNGGTGEGNRRSVGNWSDPGCMQLSRRRFVWDGRLEHASDQIQLQSEVGLRRHGQSRSPRLGRPDCILFDFYCCAPTTNVSAGPFSTGSLGSLEAARCPGPRRTEDRRLAIRLPENSTPASPHYTSTPGPAALCRHGKGKRSVGSPECPGRARIWHAATCSLSLGCSFAR